MPDVELSDDLEQWRRDVAAWLADRVVGDYATLQGRGGPGDEEYGFDLRVEWSVSARPGSSASGGPPRPAVAVRR